MRKVIYAIIGIFSIVAFIYFLTIALQSTMLLEFSPNPNMENLRIAFWFSVFVMCLCVVGTAFSAIKIFKR